MMHSTPRSEANRAAFERMVATDPVLVDIQPAGDVIPGMTATTILTSGPPLEWPDYVGPQRSALIYGAIHEGLASGEEDAVGKFESGKIQIEPCHHHGAVGSVAGIYTASMPVFVVENRSAGNRGFCNLYEGESRRRLNYGVYGPDVKERLDLVNGVVADVIRRAVVAAGGVELKPMMGRALRMGDELHSRNTAATALFTRELAPEFVRLGASSSDDVQTTLSFLAESDYFFLRLSMAASKVAVDASSGVDRSSVVSAMSLSCKGFGIRISGLGDEWFTGPHCTVEGHFFEGYSKDDLVWMGGESLVTETAGLGGFAQACAFPLQQYQGGTPEAMIANNLAMYEITVGEHPDYVIPYFGFRGTPTAIDLFKVVETGITPVIDGGLGGRDGGQIGAGVIRAPIECFEKAAEAYEQRYGG
ncbi:MAG: DUF1116 domain-containing protein [Acidimicrobiia bacterium]|nr:DUF1116 domain-containing protein [Acidimicrobiia bacterium]